MVRLGPHRATKVAENAPDAAQALRAKLHRILFVVVAVVILAASAAGQGGPGWAFAIPWSLGVVVVSQAFLLRVAYELRLEGDVLAWKTPLRSGSVHLADIGRLRPAVWGRNAEQIELTSGKRDHRHRSIRIPVRRARPCGRRSRGACRSQSLRDHGWPNAGPERTGIWVRTEPDDLFLRRQHASSGLGRCRWTRRREAG